MACLRMLALSPATPPPDPAVREPAKPAAAVPPVAEIVPPATERPQVESSAQAAASDVPAWEDLPAPASPEPAAESAAADHTPPTPAPAEPAPEAKAETVAVQVAVDADPSHDEGPAWEDIPIDAEAAQSEPYGGEPYPDPISDPIGPLDEEFESMAPAGDDAPMPRFEAPRRKSSSPRLRDMTSSAWPALAASLPLTGLAAELARQSEWLGVKDDEISLRVAVRTLAESPGQARLCTLLSEYFGTVVRLKVEYGATGSETARAVELAERARRQEHAEQAVHEDPFVQTLIKDFGAQIVPGSVRAPIDKAA